VQQLLDKALVKFLLLAQITEPSEHLGATDQLIPCFAGKSLFSSVLQANTLCLMQAVAG